MDRAPGLAWDGGAAGRCGRPLRSRSERSLPGLGRQDGSAWVGSCVWLGRRLDASDGGVFRKLRREVAPAFWQRTVAGRSVEVGVGNRLDRRFGNEGRNRR